MEKKQIEQICKNCKWWKDKEHSKSIFGESHCSCEIEIANHPWFRGENGICINTKSFELKNENK